LTPSTFPFQEAVPRIESRCGMRMSVLRRLGKCSNGPTAKIDRLAPLVVL